MQAVFDLIPGPLVKGFLLTPDNVFDVIVLLDEVRVVIDRERVKLFQPDQRHVFNTMNFSRFEQIEIDFATTEDETTRLFHFDRLDFGDNQLKPATRELTYWRD